MYLELLKEYYFKERRKLEAIPLYKEEAALRFIGFKKVIVLRQQDNLSFDQISGRSDISEELKENLVQKDDMEEKLGAAMNKLIESDSLQNEDDEKKLLRGIRYAPEEYAEYLFQLEKVYALEAELENNRLFPEDVYSQLKGGE